MSLLGQTNCVGLQTLCQKRLLRSNITQSMVGGGGRNLEPCVLISGGGPSVLLAAILLNNIGVTSIVVERAGGPDEWSSKSYTLVLGEKGLHGLERGGPHEFPNSP